MLKKIFLISFLFAAFVSNAQFQKPIGYGFEYRRLVVDTLFAFPSDTFTIAANLKSYMWAARKGDSIYLWSPTQDMWVLNSGGGSDTDSLFGVQDNLMAASRTVNMGGNVFRFDDGTFSNYFDLQTKDGGYFEYSLLNPVNNKSVFMTSTPGEWDITTTNAVVGNAFYTLVSTSTPSHQIIAGSNMYAVDFNWRMVNDGTAAGSYFRWNRNSEHTGNQIIASDSNITMRSKTALQGTYRGIFVDSVGQLGIDLPTSSSSKTYKLLLRNQSDRMVYESNYSLSDLPQIQQSRVSSQFDKTNETLADITGLTANVAAGKTYRFEAKLYTTSSSSGGIKVAIAGTATATAIVYEGLTTNAGLITQSRSVALAGAVGGVTAVTASYVVITGTITVNAAGTLTVQSARNAASGTTSILVGSTFEITEIL